MVNENVREQSEFNMAVSYLNRLNALLYACDDAAIQLDVYTWFHSLTTLFRELSTEMDKEEIKKYNETMGKINKLVGEAINYQSRTGKQEIKPELHYELHTFEINLRSILKESGLQNRMKDDPAFALK